MEIEENYKYGKWENCIRLSNGKIEIVTTTDIGPRFIKFGFIDDRNIFMEPTEVKSNIGSSKFELYDGTRFWIAPEAYPKSYYHDNEKVEYDHDDETLNLVSNIETSTRMQKEINIRVDEEANYLKIIYRLHNKNLWDVKCAIWAVSQMCQVGRCIIPQELFVDWEENQLPVRPLVLWSYTTMDDDRWNWGKRYIQLDQNKNSVSKQKIGLLNTLGWVSYYSDGYLFVRKYKYDPEAIYTDFGVNTEIYTDPRMMEIETLGEYTEVKSGSFIEHEEYWYMFEVEIDGTEKSIDQNILPLIEETRNII